MGKDDINFNIKLTTQQKKTLCLVILILIPLILAAFFRAYPATIPATDTWAEQSVNNFYQQQITAQIRAQFPNLPDAQLQERVAQEYATLRQTQGPTIEQQIAQTSEQFRQQLKNDQGETYLLAIDPWFYLQEAENTLANGHTGTELRDGVPWDGQRFAPLGTVAQHNFHSNTIIAVWHILKIFDRDMTLMGGAFWVPLIIASLATIPAFFIARRRAGNLGGFIAATIVGVHSAFLGRTPAGFSDTDAYNVFLPLMVAWLFLEAFEAKEQWKKLALATGSGVLLGIYSKYWVGYWYILDILLAVIIGYVGYTTFRILYHNYQQRQKNKKVTPFFKSETWTSIKSTLLVGAVFYAATGVVVSILHSFSRFLVAPINFLNFAQLKDPVNPTLWPNVLTTVAELNEVAFTGVVASMGGKFLFWLALIGVAISILPKKLESKHVWYAIGAIVFTTLLTSSAALQLSPLTYLILLGIPLAIGLFIILEDKKGVDIKYALFMLIWFIAAMYTTTQGVRFTLVLVPPLAIAVGTAAGLLLRHLTGIVSQQLEISKKIVTPTLTIILLLILVSPVMTAHQIGQNEIPSMSDGWYNSLTNIRDNSQPDAIITSWWDFGHWFKAIADRSVTFDGGSQDTPMAHWVGKLLLSTDEEESTGILRMLNCGSQEGFTVLNSFFNDNIRTKSVMNQIVQETRSDAEATLLGEGLSSEQGEQVLALTHCQPPESFLITSQDMVGKAAVWGHFGSWSFERAYIYNELRDQPQTTAVADMVARFNYTEEQAINQYVAVRGLTTERAVASWISPWPSYISGWIGCQEQTVGLNTTALGIDSQEEIENQTVAVCPTNRRISTSAQGDVVIENILVARDNPEASRFRYGVWSGGVRFQATDEGKPSVLYYAHTNATDGIEEVSFEEPTSGLGLLYDEENQRAMIMDPLHAGSTFTQLFYLEGKYNDEYELFSDRTTFNGQRVMVWKARWD